MHLLNRRFTLRKRAVAIATLYAVLVGPLPLHADDEQRSEVAPRQSLLLTIDYGDGVQKRFTRLKYTDEMTVLDLMQAAAKHPRGIRIRYRGRAATAFLYQIDDLANEPGGRGWLYRVNGKRADRGMAVYRLKPEDTILWEFDKF